MGKAGLDARLELWYRAGSGSQARCQPWEWQARQDEPPVGHQPQSATADLAVLLVCSWKMPGWWGEREGGTCLGKADQ